MNMGPRPCFYVRCLGPLDTLENTSLTFLTKISYPAKSVSSVFHIAMSRAMVHCGDRHSAVAAVEGEAVQRIWAAFATIRFRGYGPT